MKKSVLAAIGLFFGLAGIIFASDPFTNIDEISVQHWNEESNQYSTKTYIDDDSSLSEIQSILNEAGHKKKQLEMAQQADVKLTISYDNGKQEKIYLWKESSLYALFTSSEREGTYQMYDRKGKEALKSIIE